MKTVEDFETEYREALDKALNQLQTATLLLAMAETQLQEVGNSVKNLSQSVETFINTEKDRKITNTIAEASLYVPKLTQKIEVCIKH